MKSLGCAVGVVLGSARRRKKLGLRGIVPDPRSFAALRMTALAPSFGWAWWLDALGKPSGY